MSLPDVSSLATYGGALLDYDAVVDPTTDRAAASANKAYADAAAATVTVPRVVAQFTAAATTGAMALVSHIECWTEGGAAAPALARSGTGTFTITYPATVNDSLGVVHTVNLRYVWASCTSATVAYNVNVTCAANVITVYVFNTSDALNDAAGVDFVVFAI